MTKHDTLVDTLSAASTATSVSNEAPVERDEVGRPKSPVVNEGALEREAVGTTKSLGVVHPCGKMMWIPYHDNWTTLDMLKSDVAKTWSMEDVDFQIARATPLLSDALIEHQCMEGEIMYLLPKVSQSIRAQSASPPRVKQQREVGSLNTSSLSCQSNQSNDSTATPTTPYQQSWDTSGGNVALAGSAWFHLPLEEKIIHASHNLMKMVNNSKQCTVLQTNLENAHNVGIDCSAIFSKVEAHLCDLIIHPAGNYLVTRCFDYCPSLITVTAKTIGSNVRTYALHKHASYVIEAILTHTLSPVEARDYLITEIFASANRVPIATHDSGNFVIQKAIEVCPDELLPMMMEGVQAVALLTPHGAKMQKKVQGRLNRGGQSNAQSRHQRHQQPQQQPVLQQHTSVQNPRHGQQHRHQGHGRRQSTQPPCQQPVSSLPPSEFCDPYDVYGQQVPQVPTTTQYGSYGYESYDQYPQQQLPPSNYGYEVPQVPTSTHKPYEQPHSMHTPVSPHSSQHMHGAHNVPPASGHHAGQCSVTSNSAPPSTAPTSTAEEEIIPVHNPSTSWADMVDSSDLA